MELFIDTANIEEIREINRFGVIAGVTTNPTLIAREDLDFKTIVQEIVAEVDGPISVEVVGETWEEMVEAGKAYHQLHDNIVIKVPMNEEGLKATHILAAADIPVNVTLIFSAAQAILATKAGAAYISPFLGRLDDIGENGMLLIEEITQAFAGEKDPAKMIAASVRGPQHVVAAAKAGADIATIPYKVLKQMFKHPLTDLGIERFNNDWKNVRK